MFSDLTHLLGGQCNVYLTQIRLHLSQARKLSHRGSDAVGLRGRYVSFFPDAHTQAEIC
jgi:hypothetical protein